MKECYIKKFANLVIDNYDDEDNYFYDEMKLIQKHGYIEEVTEEIINKLIELKNKVYDIGDKATIIESIIFFNAEYYDRYEKRFTENLDKIKNEYIVLISKHASRIDDISSCLKDLIYLGYNEEKLITEVIRVLDEKYAIKILLNYHYRSDNVSGINDVYKEYLLSDKVKARTNIISTFLLIVNDKCSRYDYINSFSFIYKSVESAVRDWAWRAPGSTRVLVEENIITEKEGIVLEKLGEYLYECNKNGEVEDKQILGDFYNEFFEGKNPIDAMFCLP